MELSLLQSKRLDGVDVKFQQLEQAESFKYLEATIRQDGRIDLEVNNRIAAAG
jgi:hypothetical protein